MRIIALITDPVALKQLLQSLGLPQFTARIVLLELLARNRCSDFTNNLSWNGHLPGSAHGRIHCVTPDATRPNEYCIESSTITGKSWSTAGLSASSTSMVACAMRSSKPSTTFSTAASYFTAVPGQCASSATTARLSRSRASASLSVPPVTQSERCSSASTCTKTCCCLTHRCKILRPRLKFNRSLLHLLFHAAWDSWKQFIAEALPECNPAGVHILTTSAGNLKKFGSCDRSLKLYSSVTN